MRRRTVQPGSDRLASGAADCIRLRPFSQSLPMTLMRARERVMRRFRPMLQRHGLSDQQWRVIRALAEAEALDIAALSARCLIHPASLSRILPRLDADGLISRRSNAEDARRVAVRLTAAGRRLHEEISPRAERIYAEIGRAIGSERLRVLEEALAHLDLVLQEEAGDPRPRTGEPSP